MCATCRNETDFPLTNVDFSCLDFNFYVLDFVCKIEAKKSQILTQQNFNQKLCVKKPAKN